MSTFELHLFDKHAIIRDGKHVLLIDTGAPNTIHIDDRIEFCSKSFSCSTNYVGLTVAKLSEMLGMEITTLLGADIIRQFKMSVDYRNLSVEFSNNEIEWNGQSTDIQNFMGIPIVKMRIDNQPLHFFLDTGAKLSYLSESLTSNYEIQGMEQDFYPGIGTFQTPRHEIPTTIGDYDFIVNYGNLPASIMGLLSMGGAQGIIGYDFFNQFKVLLDLDNQRMSYTPHTS